MNICCYLNKKNKQCNKNCKNNYCEKHIIYENVIEPSDMINCSICACGIRYIKDKFKNCQYCREKRALKKRKNMTKNQNVNLFFMIKQIVLILQIQIKYIVSYIHNMKI